MMPRSPRAYTGRIIVRLIEPVVTRLKKHAANNLANPDLPTLHRVASELELDSLGDFLADLPGFAPDKMSSRLVTGQSTLDIVALEDQAAESRLAPIHSLVSYYHLNPGPMGAQKLKALVGALNRLDEIDVAFREPWVGAPGGCAGAAAVDPSGEAHWDEQGYLRGDHNNTNPQQRDWSGINAYSDAVWCQFSGDNIGFVDLESGWGEHADIPPVNLRNGLDHINDDFWLDHGTSVLGIVLGKQNSQYVIGVAPKANYKGAFSWDKGGPAPKVGVVSDTVDIAGAVLAAVAVMDPGDVLLIEVEVKLEKKCTDFVSSTYPDGFPVSEGYPIELVDCWFDAIRLATALGIVVVEAGGNGSGCKSADADSWRNLDEVATVANLEGDPSDPDRSLDRNNCKFSDSGAIMVSACRSAVLNEVPPKHERLPAGPFGSRIDCYAWGENVFAIRYTDGTWTPNENGFDPLKAYDIDFGHTSAAAAIIAGAALLVQEMFKTTLGNPASPTQLRAVLSSRGTAIKGQPQVMPDLALIAEENGFFPDVFIRDRVGDDGSIPNDLVYASPDIIIGDTELSDVEAQAKWGGNNLANVVPANTEVTPDQPNYVYVRATNTSLRNADGVTAKVYWFDSSPYSDPDGWHEIGETAPFNVPATGVLVVSRPITWQPGADVVPSSRHGCLVALLHHPLDPRPPLVPQGLVNPSDAWDTFLAYVGNNNNVAWRNFNFVEEKQPPSGGGGVLTGEFVIQGSAGQARVFDIKLLNDLSNGVQVLVDVPDALYQILSRSRHPVISTRRIKGGRRLAVPGESTVVFSKVRLPGGSRFECRWRVIRKPRQLKPVGVVAVSQMYGGREIGRVTWAAQRSSRKAKRG